MSDVRWWLVLALALAYGLYHPLNQRPSKYYWQWPIDLQLPLLPGWVWVYCTYFLMLPGSIALTWWSPVSQNLLTSLLIAKAISLPIWFFWPNGVKRPKIEKPSNSSERLLALIYKHDGDTNGCPSSHVFTSLIGSWYLAGAFPQLTILFLGWGVLISISTVLTKQHYVVDVICGFALACLSIYLVGLLHF